jgi:geranylgeranyl pyrophosphate synthase
MTHCNTSIDIEYWMHKAKIYSAQTEPEAPCAAELEAAFRQALPLPHGLEPRFESALRHVLRHPGTMVRPRVVCQVATAYGMDSEAAIQLGVALEYFHTASLIFDDLPSMDNATSRRGAPCVHVAFGESTATLVALALINRAYALTWRVIAQCPLEVQDEAARYLEDRLGVCGLLNGQSLDLNYSHLPHDRETIERVAHGKTVSLIRLTLVLSAMLGSATRREVQLFERMAMAWGLAYQMVDDLKDVLQSSSQSGKTAARDLHLDRPNIALAIGVPDALSRLTRLIDLGDRTLDCLLALRPALRFLRRLRTDLQYELRRVTTHSCAAAAS